MPCRRLTISSGLPGLVSLLQALPVLLGELGVDGEECVAVGAFARGEFQGVLDGLERVGFDAGVLDVLLGREHLLELLTELELTDDAARFDVGEHSFEVTDAGGELLHLAETLLDFAEMRGDLAEGLGEPGLEGGVEFLVDGDAHLFELGGVVLVEFSEAVFDGEAEFLLLGVRFAGEFIEAAVQSLAGFELVAVYLGDEIGEALRDGVEVLLDGEAEGLVGGFVVRAKSIEAGLDELAELSDVADDLGSKGRGVGLQFATHLDEAGPDLGVEASELVGKLRETGILFCLEAACGLEGRRRRTG